MPGFDAQARLAAFEGLPTFYEDWPAGGWSFDRRHDCVASTIASTYIDEAWQASRKVFVTIWDERRLPRAPTLVRDLAEMTGGVRSDQFIFTTGVHDGLMLYGLWWPWGGESTNVSMRVGLVGSVYEDDREELRQFFKVAETDY